MWCRSPRDCVDLAVVVGGVQHRFPMAQWDHLAYPAGWARLAQKESGGRWHIHGRSFSGGLQHTAKTWNAYRHCAGVTATAAHLASPADQIAVARYVLGGQGPCAWPMSSWKLGVASCGYGR